MPFIKNEQGFSVEAPDKETVQNIVDALYRTFARGDATAFDQTLVQLGCMFEGQRYDIARDEVVSYPWKGYLAMCREHQKKEAAIAELERTAGDDEAVCRVCLTIYPIAVQECPSCRKERTKLEVVK